MTHVLCAGWQRSAGMRAGAWHKLLMLSQGHRTHLISPRPDHQHPVPLLWHAQENGPAAILI